MRFSVPALALAAALLASPALAAKIDIEDKALPPDLSSGEVQLTIVVSNLDQAQYDKLIADANLVDNLDVVLPLIDSGTLKYKAEEATDALPFYLASGGDAPAPEQAADGTWTVKIPVTITESIGGKLDERYDNSMEVKISFNDPAGTELVAETSFTLTREIFAIKSQPTFKETAVEGTHQQLRVHWNHTKTAVTEGGSGTKEPRRMNVYVVERELVQDLTLNAKKFDSTSGATSDVVSCVYQDPGADRGACISCPAGVYLDQSAIAKAAVPGLKIQRAASKDEDVTISGLSNDKQYVVFMQWEPSGLTPSECVVGQPSPNLSLTELNGESEAEVVDFRCFVATAAYGSPLHDDVALFRSFRDDVLMPTLPGRLLVETYYLVSPPLASFIARHPALRDATRDALEKVAGWVRGTGESR